MIARLPDRRASRALLIGASRFASTDLHDLPAVRNNVHALADVLTDPDEGVLDSAACQVLTDPLMPHEVGDAITAAVDHATDMLMLYYAGHGVLNQRGVLHLAVGNTDGNAARVHFSGVPMDWLRSALADSPARNRILILDCCYSGHAAEAQSAASSAVTAALDIYGTYTLTSVPAYSTAVAPVGARFTAFTGELLDVLKTGVPEGGPLLSFADILPALSRRLATRGLPRPQHLGTGLADRIALARNVAHRVESGPPARSVPRARNEPTPSPVRRTATERDAALVAGFNSAMSDVYRRAKREAGYNAAHFLRMISDLGGLEAARRLLHAGSVSGGFTALWEKGRLDLSVEAVVLQERFADLFTDEEIEIARNRLAEYGYRPSQTS